MKIINVPLLLFLTFIAPIACAHEPSAPVFEVPILDLPYNAKEGVRAPSMQQSLAMTASFYETTHAELMDFFGERKKLGRISIAIFDALTTAGLAMPLSDVWLHEEFHRAVMGDHGIDSHNDVYDFAFAADSIAVSHVLDEDLARLKRDSPAGFVRLGAAGIEGELALVQRLEKQQFFLGSEAWHLPLYWMVKFGAYGYVASGTDEETNAETDEMNLEDGTNVERRDFTGHDFTAWVYDLARPDEPYAARGVHPSGVGVDRYRKPIHLTQEERDYLDKQGRLQLVNFLDSNLVGISAFRRGDTAFNVTGAHVLTSFGHVVDANFFLRRNHTRLFVIVHAYGNKEKTFPGVEAQLIEKQMSIAGRDVHVTPRVALWMQPVNQRFRDTEGALGGLASLRVDHRSAFVELEAKTRGWVMGVESLDAGVALRAGVSLRRRAE